MMKMRRFTRRGARAALPYFAVQAFDGTSIDVGIYTSSGRSAAAARGALASGRRCAADSRAQAAGGTARAL